MRKVSLLAASLLVVLASIGAPSPAAAASSWSFFDVSPSTGTVQGETDIVADSSTRVNVAWMTGLPGAATMWSAYFNGSTWAAAAAVAGGSPADVADPALGETSTGTVYLNGIQHIQTLPTQIWNVIDWKSGTHGASYGTAATEYHDQYFNDRDWMTIDSSNKLDVVFSPRHPSGDGNCDRPIYFIDSSDGSTWSAPVQVNANRDLDSRGDLAARITVTSDGHIAVGARAVPVSDGVCGNPQDSVQSDGYAYLCGSSCDGTGTWTPYLFTTSGTLIAAPASNFVKTHPSITSFGNSVYAVWVGINGSQNSVYVARMDEGPSGYTGFTAPTVVDTAAAGSLSHATIAIGPKGTVYVMYLKKTSTKWAPWYGFSTNQGGSFQGQSQTCGSSLPWTSPNTWDGDWNDATTNGSTLFASFGVSSTEGTFDGIWVEELPITS